jgi:hypothetical protein
VQREQTLSHPNQANGLTKMGMDMVIIQAEQTLTIAQLPLEHLLN